MAKTVPTIVNPCILSDTRRDDESNVHCFMMTRCCMFYDSKCLRLLNGLLQGLEVGVSDGWELVLVTEG